MHCERPVRVASRRFGWKGEYEHERVNMVCVECGAELTLTIKTNVGLPSGAQ